MSSKYDLAPHPTYEKMFYVVFPDGRHSTQFYNKTRAKEQIFLLLEEEEQKQILDPNYDASRIQLEGRGCV